MMFSHFSSKFMYNKVHIFNFTKQDLSIEILPIYALTKIAI